MPKNLEKLGFWEFGHGRLVEKMYVSGFFPSF
jgi:hypothetical protein